MTHVVVEGPSDLFVAVSAEPGFTKLRPLVVGDAESAAIALRMALRGDELLVHAAADRAVLDRLYDDLRRTGPVTVRTSPRAVETLASRLTDEQRALLRLLAEGRSLHETAAELHISPRTADRRLADARTDSASRRRSRRSSRLAANQANAVDYRPR